MKGGTLQITWHGSDPVLTLDFHRLSGLLATGGADHDIKFWTVHEAQGRPLPSATFHSSLSYHTAAVNVVRFSASGDQLASGADGGEILLWKPTENPEAPNMWKLAKNLRFHVKDVLDLQWSSDGAFLVSGSVDNTVIIWDIAKGNPQQVLKDHMHYVQGVAWDPIGQYVASISGDRTCRIYNSKPHNSKIKSQESSYFSCQSVLVKADVSKQEDDATKVPASKLNLFHDETLPSFFRRLAWSPDGSFLLVPAGIHKFPSESVSTNTAFIISRKDLSRPAVQLPGASKPVVAVRFCPVLFSCYSNSEQNLNKDSNDTGVFKLPYRLVFAIATLNSLFVYDTESAYPLAVLAGIHYAAITDVAWSHDGKFLAVSSQDGFCSLVTFEQGELGTPLPLEEIPPFVAKLMSPAKGVAGIHARSNEATTKTRSRVDCNGTSLKNVDSQSNSALGMEDEAQCNGMEQTQVTALPEKQDKGSIPCRELPRQEAAIHNYLHVESQDAANRLEPVNYESAMVSETAEYKDVSKKPRRIAPVPISNESLQQAGSASASPPNLATQLQLGLEAKVAWESSLKRPRRITPVAISCAPEQDHEATTSAINSSLLLQPQQEAPLALVMQPSTTTVVNLQEGSHAGCANADANSNSQLGLDASNGKDLQSSPKKLRRITPVPVIASCETPQITEASGDDMK